MKKRLEAELISLAHRVLKLKNKSEVDQLYLESKKLYETITVLKFYNDNFDLVKNSVSQKDLDEKLAISLDEKIVEANIEIPVSEFKEEIVAEVVEEKVEISEIVSKEEIVVEEVEFPAAELKEEIVAEVVEAQKIEIPEVIVKEDFALEIIEEELVIDQNVSEIESKIIEELIEKPDFELTFDSKINEDKKPKVNEIIFDDFLGINYADPVFIKPEDLAIEKEIEKKENEIAAEKLVATFDKNSKGIIIGLNDRVAFMKYLFANSSEDYNRVLSQLMTFNSYQEAQTFIADMVKPDYNDWKGKEDYEARFMEIVEKKFS